jgi:hypothetical protein
MRSIIYRPIHGRPGGCGTSKAFPLMQSGASWALLRLQSGCGAAERRAHYAPRWKEELIMTELNIPASLLNQVRGNLRPVRPLAPPSRRLIGLLPLAVLLFFGPPTYYEWRENLPLLPAWTSWGLSALESLGGVALMGLALREAVPGLAVRTRWILLAFAGGVLVFTCVSLTTAHMLPTPLHNPDAAPRLAWECVLMELLFATPSLAISAWLVARALPTRPAPTGATYGLAVGLMTDAGVRLFCWIDQPLHVFAAHGGAILLGAIGGALTAVMIERIKYRRLRTLANLSATRE